MKSNEAGKSHLSTPGFHPMAWGVLLFLKNDLAGPALLTQLQGSSTHYLGSLRGIIWVFNVASGLYELVLQPAS
jgi:hypothetical protein